MCTPMLTTFAELTFGWDIELKEMWSDRKVEGGPQGMALEFPRPHEGSLDSCG